ncbi:unnamed protein product [Clavelina lepadiformis]|uniref:Uncharacterized protein n=1 Tax=Clavelina lepadiformis TaxID=159417 RepID=A0ABP0F8T2_CLALP
MRGPPETLHQDKPPDYIVEEPYDRIGVELPNDLVMIEPDFVVPDEEEVGEGSRDPEHLLECYGWMANADEFDKQVMEDLEQEDYMENCFQQMWKEEEDQLVFYPNQLNNGSGADGSPEANRNTLVANFDKLAVAEPPPEPPSPEGYLNPNAVEYIPRSESES